MEWYNSGPEEPCGREQGSGTESQKPGMRAALKVGRASGRVGCHGNPQGSVANFLYCDSGDIRDWQCDAAALGADTADAERERASCAESAGLGRPSGGTTCVSHAHTGGSPSRFSPAEPQLRYADWRFL